jgi:hypothetical protein
VVHAKGSESATATTRLSHLLILHSWGLGDWKFTRIARFYCEVRPVWSTEADTNHTKPTPLWGAGNPGSSHPAGIRRPGPKRPKTSQRVEAESVKMNDGDRSVAASLLVLICRGCGAPTRERSADVGAMLCDKRCTRRVARRDDDIKTCLSALRFGYERVENGLLSADNRAGLHYSCHCTLYFSLARVGHYSLASCSAAI